MKGPACLEGKEVEATEAYESDYGCTRRKVKDDVRE